MATVMSEQVAERQFLEYASDIYGVVEICGYTYDAMRVLAEVDPIAYRQAFLGYCDNEGIEIN